MNSAKVKRAFRSKFGRKIKKSEIRDLWEDYLETKVFSKLLTGYKVYLDPYSALEVVGTPEPGKSYHINRRRRGVKYKLIYTHSLSRRPLYITGAGKLKKRIRETLCNTNHYFRICSTN